tara:strand:- start:14079 stop:26219 length:12141 start_codon:yes stop_codon:yes gene_type:complete
MTDYRTKTKKTKLSDRKEKFFTKKKPASVNETKQGLISRDQESDGLIKKSRDLTNKYRPDVTVKDPSTFAFFGSAKKYYEDAFDKIIDYYPYDGSKKEILEWYDTASPVEIGVLQNHWPSYVGHISLKSPEYVSFYSGPQSIAESEYMGNFTKGETGLKLDAAKGNTVEFWLKKHGWSDPEEVIFDIGSYPGKVASAESGQFKVFLSNSSGSPFYASYKLKTNGVVNLNIGSSNLSKDTVADGQWHHYALKAFESSGSLHMKLYVDGNYDSLVTSSVSPMSSVDTYMSGRIGAGQPDATGSLSGSIDDFRFWKGQRSSKQISRFFDQKIFASENLEDTYTTRLGLYYRFNKPTSGVDSEDKLVLDYSGNDITGIINQYNTAVRVEESAITISPNTSTTELKDPVLSSNFDAVSDLKISLLKIGESHDTNNSSFLKNFVPEWVFDSRGQGLSNENSQVSILFHMMAQEFDNIRMTLDSVKSERSRVYESITHEITSHDEPGALETSSSYMENNFFIGCDDTGEIYAPTRGSHAEFSLRKCEHAGLQVVEKPLINTNPVEEYDLKVDQITVTKPFEEIRRSILENVYTSAKYTLRRKGTNKSFEAIMSSYGVDEDLISFNVYANNAETFINNNLLDSITEEKNSIYFGQNRESTIFLSSSANNEKTYLQADSEETEYTFEGTFIFPTRKGFQHNLTISSVFGLSEVSAVNNTLTATSANNADFVVKVVKDSAVRDDAKFVLSSPSGIIPDVESSVFKDVYKNSRWNIALKITKNLDNNFISSSATTYKAELVGHNHLLDTLQNSFRVTSPLDFSEYESFRNANKTVFIGAHRENITGSVTTETDIKVVDFNAWNDDLSIQELSIRSMSPSTAGRDKAHLHKDNYNTISKQMDKNKILSIQFDKISGLTATNDITVEDATSGSADNVIKYGALLGNKYPAKSTVFTAALPNVVQREFLPVVRNIPVDNLYGKDGVQLKNSEIDKFELSSRPQTKLFSFEKSMQRAVSREMVNFVGGLIVFNNLIGEPVNKYRKNYKMLEHLRRKFFETVESENQFERFVSYFRWIDKSIGHFLEQLIPSTAISNTGIEDVVESHALERNKYDHKAPFIEKKEYDSGLEANLLAINELLYDWEHGHTADGENDHCLWQKDRKERTGDRETLRKVLTTKVEGSTYVTRNLVKPYRHTIDRQTLLNIGSNRNANKNRDLYKIVNEGKEISIAADDIYEFKQCNDVLSPQEEKLYSAKTNTTTTDGYLDADADMILPFSLYSSSVGVDFEDFKQNLKITNNHDGTPSLQGSFVRTHVGGMPHRNVKFGTADKDRPEAYDISSSANTFVVKQTVAPKSMFHRDLGGARFYHIGNVKSTDTPLVFGNYSKDYEIVMTSGRSLNNNYLVENEGLHLTGALQASSFISGSTDFYVPERPARDHVIVNRFSAPGSPESDGAYGLDRESAEYSINDTVNYRNALVRGVENILSSEYSDRFGYRSGSSIQASKHMTNRNPRRFTGSLEQEFNYDNNFVQHEIPQNDYGYVWITSSANESVYSFLNKNENTGHQHLLNISGTLKSSQTITFLEISEMTSNLDFVNLNTFTTRSLSPDTNMLTNSSVDLNSIVLNRQGPSGWPSWKQTRGAQHPVTRNHRKNNKLSVVSREHGGKKYAFVDSIKGDYKFDFKDTLDNSGVNSSARVVQNYDEMYITSKFNPLNVNVTRFEPSNINLESLDTTIRAAIGIPIVAIGQYSQHHMWTNDEYYLSAISRDAARLNSGLSSDEDDKFTLFGPQGALSEEEQDMLSDALGGFRQSAAVSMRTSVQNKITGFAQREFENLVFSGVGNSEIWTNYIDSDKYTSDTGLAVLKEFLLESAFGRGTMRELNYIETIYPREINTYKSKVRTRSSFDFFGWDNSRTNRHLVLTGSVSYAAPLIELTTLEDVRLFQPASTSHIIASNEKDFKTKFFGDIEIIDLNSTGSDATISDSRYITSSTWVLDSRRDFTSLPLNLNSSFFNQGDTFLRQRSQGTRGEGILQNDFSIFGLGYNGLRGAPPPAPVYNRRIPQSYNGNSYLSGEAKFESANTRTGPFYDSYKEYSTGMKAAGQTYSLVPEFRIHNVIEDYLSLETRTLAQDDFLELTGAVYHTSSGNLSVGTQFFETYSMTDFMKYFQVVKEDITDSSLGLVPGRLTLRCQAVKRFLPYRGFYPAERVVQLSEIFNRCYLHKNSYRTEYVENSQISRSKALSFLNLRISNAKAQAIKPLMAPGVLMNSIKTGLAVDYPIFSSSIGSATDYIFQNQITSSLNDFSLLSLGSKTAFTGSLINSSEDQGMPRISGSVDCRIDFDDLLFPSRIWDKIIYDNEPHPSASMLYGQAAHLSVLDRPTRFGNVDREMSTQFSAIDFKTSKGAFARSMLPFQLATHNFCAETVNFFLEDGMLNTATSSPGSQYFDNETYKMRVYLKNIDTTMYDRHSSFGPPVDEGNPEITKYEMVDTTVLGVAATASITFNNSKTIRNYTGSTVTITDYQNAATTYEFIEDVVETHATGTVKFDDDTGSDLATNDLKDKTITVPNFTSGDVTYQFKQSHGGIRATASIGFENVSRTFLSQSLIGLLDHNGTDAEFKFVQEDSGSFAQSTLYFDTDLGHSSAPTTIAEIISPWQNSNMYPVFSTGRRAAEGTTAYDHYIRYPARWHAYSAPSSPRNGTTDRQVLFFNEEDTTLARFRMAFNHPGECYGLAASVLSGNIPNQTASLTFETERYETFAKTQIIDFFTSNQGGGTFEPAAGTNRVRIDVYGLSSAALASRVREVLNDQTAGTLGESWGNGDLAGLGSNLYAEDRGSTLSLYPKTGPYAKKAKRPTTNSTGNFYVQLTQGPARTASSAAATFTNWPVNISTSSYPSSGEWTASGISGPLIMMTTGSADDVRPRASGGGAQAWDGYREYGYDKYVPYAMEYSNSALDTTFTSSSYKWPEYIQRVNDDIATSTGTQKPFRFAIGSYSATNFTWAAAFHDAFNLNFLKDQQAGVALAASASVDSLTKNIVYLTFQSKSSAANQVPPNHDVYSAAGSNGLRTFNGAYSIISEPIGASGVDFHTQPIVNGQSSGDFQYTGNKWKFTGGQNIVSYSIAQVLPDSSASTVYAVRMPDGATIPQVVKHLSASIAAVYGTEIETNANNLLLSLTQSSIGIGGNNTITNTDFVGSGMESGDIIGFAGGSGSTAYSNNQTLPNSNKAVVIGTINVGGINGSNNYNSISTIAGNFRDAVEANQDITGTVSYTYPNRVLSLKQGTAGVLPGTRTITYTDSGNDFFSNSDFLGFGGGTTGADYTTGQAIGGGNTNIAVVIGTQNVGGNPSNDTSLSHANARTELNTAVTAMQSSTINRATTSTSAGAILQLTQRGTGSAGNNAIADSNFEHDASDILGFAGGVNFVQGTVKQVPTKAVQSGSHGYLPYVAPFLDPDTSPYAELSFTPTRAGSYSMTEVLNDLQVTYYNMPAPSNAADNINYKEAMVLSASIELKGLVKLRGDHTTDFAGSSNGQSFGKSNIDPNFVDLSRWVIRPKWEAPVADFTHVTASAINLLDNSERQVTGSPWKTRYQSKYYELLKTSSVPYLTASTGIWHQSGSLIDELSNKGYYMVIESGDSENSDTYASKDLASKVGFLENDENSRSIRLGKIASEKTVWEAVVAIPFYNDPEEGIKFFALNQDGFRAARIRNTRSEFEFSQKYSDNSLSEDARKLTRSLYDNFYNSPGTDGTENIAYQLRMMEKFIIPPQFDFMANYDSTGDRECEPFVQYIFQFKGKLTEEDLSSMWQNLYPNSQSGIGSAKHSSPFPNSGTSNNATMDFSDVEYVSNFLDTESVGMFQRMTSNYDDVSEFLNNEVRWLVFKAKQRGVSDYRQMIQKSVTQDNVYNLLEQDGKSYTFRSLKRDIKPQFNWPYDYFSIVELAKLESKVDFYDNADMVGVPKERGPSRSDTQSSPRAQDAATGASNQSESTSEQSSQVADSTVFREVLLADSATPSSRVFNISGATISSGTEQLFVNGILQSQGSGNDYTISGNTVTFAHDLVAGDSVVVSYVKQ